MIKKIKNHRKFNYTMQTKMILICMLSSLIIFMVNIFMYFNINRITEKIDQIYVGNVSLNEIHLSLRKVHGSMTSYLNTKSSDSMEEYFRNQEDYSKLINGLNNIITNDEGALAEKNIKNMSETYLDLTHLTIEAKRGRKVEQYKAFYEEASEIYKYLNSTIYDLNNSKFQANYENYGRMLISLQASEVLNIVILFLVGTFNIFIILIFARSITKPLQQLAWAANQVAEGNLQVEKVPVKGSDEVGIVTSAFNQMVINLRTFIEQLKVSMEHEREMKEKELLMETHLKDAQLKYLRAQINPHFLFNTLNAGAQLAMMEGADRTYTYTQNVADFFRYNLTNGNDLVSLREEIKLVDNYMYILNVRFSNELNYKKNIDEELLDVQVPSMTLQPIVENCVNYGVRDIEREKNIYVSVYKQHQNICISISDNGIGMSKEKIKQVLAGIREGVKIESDSNGIGLQNVIRRLKLLYEKQNVFNIVSEGKDKGTTIIILIPIGEEEREYV